jgi:hypothetical protein
VAVVKQNDHVVASMGWHVIGSINQIHSVSRRRRTADEMNEH